MEEYVSNSHKSKKESLELETREKKVESVVSGSAKTKRKSEMRKFTDVFVSEDISNVKSYIFLDVLVPAVKKAISDIVTNGIDMILYGEAGRSRKGNTSASKVSYRSYYDAVNDRDRRREVGATARNVFDYDDILFETRGDAEAVLDAMNDIISQFGSASVGDLYDLANVQTSNYTVNKYGWTDIFGCKPVRVRDGYILKLPRPIPLNK